jgi:hypothetical protein
VASSTINRLITIFQSAFHSLGAQVNITETERLAMLVHHTMESKTRAYHTTGHVFTMCQDMNPRQVLAALFHDLVYYQLDGGYPIHTHDILHDVTHLVDGALVLRSVAANDVPLLLCAALFDFTPGQALPLYGGMNEFLSAVVATRLLQPHVKFSDLIAIVACIEATIPFRQADAQDLQASDRLARRVEEQYRGLCGDKISQSPEAVQIYVHRVVADAVQLANRDVSSFAVADPGLFLSSTWLLMEESNAPLALPGLYTLYEYRCGLTRMENFLRQLKPDSVFQHYRGQPSAQDMADLCAAAHCNVMFACDFLGAKITSISIIEALARCTGTDGPISMFLGDIRNPYERPDRVEDFLPHLPEPQNLNTNLLRVFERGRTLESSNDLTESPLTAFMYRCLGDDGTRQALGYARQMFEAKLSPFAFLQSLDGNMVRAIIRACSHIAVSRRDALLALEQSLEP